MFKETFILVSSHRQWKKERPPQCFLPSTQANFRCCNSHELNRMITRQNKGFSSFAFDSAHMKYRSELGLRYVKRYKLTSLPDKLSKGTNKGTKMFSLVPPLNEIQTKPGSEQGKVSYKERKLPRINSIQLSYTSTTS